MGPFTINIDLNIGFDYDHKIGCFVVFLPIKCLPGCTAEPEDSIPTEAVKYFVPGHLAGMDVSRSTAKSFFRPLTTTYLNFSCSGNELVANMGGDHVYYFDRNRYF